MGVYFPWMTDGTGRRPQTGSLASFSRPRNLAYGVPRLTQVGIRESSLSPSGEFLPYCCERGSEQCEWLSVIQRVSHRMVHIGLQDQVPVIRNQTKGHEIDWIVPDGFAEALKVIFVVGCFMKDLAACTSTAQSLVTVSRFIGSLGACHGKPRR